jgi:hypothetical protein
MLYLDMMCKQCSEDQLKKDFNQNQSIILFQKNFQIKINQLPKKHLNQSINHNFNF